MSFVQLYVKSLYHSAIFFILCIYLGWIIIYHRSYSTFPFSWVQLYNERFIGFISATPSKRFLSSFSLKKMLHFLLSLFQVQHNLTTIYSFETSSLFQTAKSLFSASLPQEFRKKIKKMTSLDQVDIFGPPSQMQMPIAMFRVDKSSYVPTTCFSFPAPSLLSSALSGASANRTLSAVTGIGNAPTSSCILDSLETHTQIPPVTPQSLMNLSSSNSFAAMPLFYQTVLNPAFLSSNALLQRGGIDIQGVPMSLTDTFQLSLPHLYQLEVDPARTPASQYIPFVFVNLLSALVERKSLFCL